MKACPVCLKTLLIPLRDRAFDIETGFKKPFSAGLFTWGIVFFGLWHVATNLVISEPGYWQNCIHFGGFAFLAALSAPISKRLVGSKSGLVIDIIYGVLVAGSAVDLVRTMFMRGPYPRPVRPGNSVF